MITPEVYAIGFQKWAYVHISTRQQTVSIIENQLVWEGPELLDYLYKKGIRNEEEF